MVQRILWLFLAALHLAPALALFRPALLARLYGVSGGEPAFPLLHHRAALFGVVVILAGWAAFDPGVRRPASVALAISIISFVAIWRLHGSPPSLRAIAVADLIGLPVLGLAAWTAFSSTR